MDSIPSIAQYQALPQIQQYGNTLFAPGIFLSTEESNDYLSSLDSDTRDYVLKHTEDFRTKQDIIDCVKSISIG